MRKLTLILIFFILLITGSCNKSSDEYFDLSKGKLWKSNPQQVLTKDEVQEEIQVKMRRLNKFLKIHQLDGILLTQVRNFYWITAGTVNNQIVLNKDVGAASLLLMKDGNKYVICNASEASRLMDEGLKDLGYELKIYNWFEANPTKDVRGKIIKQIAGEGRIGSDIDFPGTVNIAGYFKQIRYSLTDTEIKRYRWLGEQVTEAVSDVCYALKPGMEEYQIESMTAGELRSRGILPTVLLIGVDERIYKYRHALPGGARLKKYAMINVVAEKWGMPIAVTRFVHFGPLPEDLESKIKRAAWVNAKYQESTVPGKSCAAIFDECRSWYAKVGVPEEWRKHHQGGAIGYDDRDYVIYPGIEDVVQDKQSFAWNPTITGAKVEDTIIAFEDHIEVITQSGDWPMIIVDLDGKTYPQPGILIRDPQTGKIIPQEEITISETK
ncbi:MAG: aminopeptidase P family N-terminal domain-containing protein [Calditrichia bacterium]|nr:aminopeptidase P family N-terminal domain-containing protein [Calditrichia bacterium]